MALPTVADALNKIRCNYADFFIQREEYAKYDMECYGKTDNELWELINYWYLLVSECEVVNCSISDFVNTLNDIDTCGETNVTICDLQLTDGTIACDTFNLYELL